MNAVQKCQTELSFKSVNFVVFNQVNINKRSTRSNCWIPLRGWVYFTKYILRYSCIFVQDNRSNHTTIGRLMEKFRRTGSVLDDVHNTHIRTGRSTEKLRQWVIVWQKSQEPQFADVPNKLASLLINIWAYVLIRWSSHKNWNRKTTEIAENSSIRSWNRREQVQLFSKKPSFGMRRIFTWNDT